MPKPWPCLNDLLSVRAGLEVSACTGNARRITLWEALKLMFVVKNAADLPGKSHCNHPLGDPRCVLECWQQKPDKYSKNSKLTPERWQPSDLENLYFHLIKNAIKNLGDTGLNHKGDLQAWWSFSDTPTVPKTLVIPQEGKTGSKAKWMQILKNRQGCAAFAALSNRCLEYNGTNKSKNEEVARECIESLCLKQHRSNFKKRPRVERDRTVLSTSIIRFSGQPHDHSVLPLKAHLELKSGDGYLEVLNQDSAPLTHLISGKFSTFLINIIGRAHSNNREYTEFIDADIGDGGQIFEVFII